MPLDPNTLIIRDEKGRIAPGSKLGLMRRGTFNKVTRLMKQQFAKYAEEKGEMANPLIILCEIATAEKTDDAVRVAAAGKLASFLIPKKFEVEEAEPDEEKIEKLKRFRAAVLGALPSRPSVTLIEGETVEVNRDDA